MRNTHNLPIKMASEWWNMVIYVEYNLKSYVKYDKQIFKL